MASTCDFLVIGAGILGLATALRLQHIHPDARVIVLEKESAPAQHQTGRNSGVIHAGVYYKPGSLKAKFCKLGNVATTAFCDEHSIPYVRCGKLLVATNELELSRMNGLIQRCEDNGLAYEILDAKQLRAREPNIVGEGGIFIPGTGIVSYRAICEKMATLLVANGGEIHFGQTVTALQERVDSVTVSTNDAMWQAGFLVGCAGLHSDTLVGLLGRRPGFRIIPFRGEYFLLPPQHNGIVNHLIYPIPDPDLPFLGVHLTKMIDGTVTVGPNAVLAMAREGYGKLDIDLGECVRMLAYPGLRKVLQRNFAASVSELKNSMFKSGYLKQVQKYAPQLQLGDLKPYPPGIRAQAVTKDGALVDDFLFEHSPRALIVCNAPSPAATSAMPIAEHIVSEISARYGKAS